MNKYLDTQAKVLSINEKGYTIGFECPTCDAGYITTNYVQVGEQQLTIGDIIPVKISAIAMSDGIVTEVVLFDETPKAGYMPDLVKKGRELKIVNETLTPVGKYRVKEALSSNVYRLEDTADGSTQFGISEKEMEVDTLADEDAFQRIADDHPMVDYTLVHHWWENGKFEHWDLFLNDGQCTSHFVLETDPLKTTEIKAVQRVPYSEDFWTKGEQLEEIAPGEAGNPSKDIPCSVERLDMGKVAIYESAQQPDGSYLLHMEFLGAALEGRWAFTSTVQHVWHALKETVKLSDPLPMQIALAGDLGAWTETPDGLEVTGTALSFGVWNGMYWPPDVIMNSPLDDFDDMIIDVEHDNAKDVGKILEKNVVGPDVKVKFLVKDFETAEKIKNGEYTGLSIDAKVFANPVRRIITSVQRYKRLTVCQNPACKTCYFGM